jgi:hypothetical protein
MTCLIYVGVTPLLLTLRDGDTDIFIFCDFLKFIFLISLLHMVFLGQHVNTHLELNVKEISTQNYVMTNRGHLQELCHK